jgi:diaminopimelate decarboxylase
MNIDQIRESVYLPALKKGDRVVVSRVGAYNMTQWMQFITLRPRVVMIDKRGDVHVIRQNESNKDIVNLENIPEHLLIKK